jgi:hypothetical protein
MMSPIQMKHVVTHHTNAGANTDICYVSKIYWQCIMYDVFELRREFEARAGLDAGFGSLFCFSIIVLQLSQKHGDGYVFVKKYLSRRDLQPGCTS